MPRCRSSRTGFVQILLMIVLGIVERLRGGDFRGHLARIACFTHGLLETLKAGARRRPAQA